MLYSAFMTFNRLQDADTYKFPMHQFNVLLSSHYSNFVTVTILIIENLGVDIALSMSTVNSTSNCALPDI